MRKEDACVARHVCCGSGQVCLEAASVLLRVHCKGKSCELRERQHAEEVTAGVWAVEGQQTDKDLLCSHVLPSRLLFSLQKVVALHWFVFR